MKILLLGGMALATAVAAAAATAEIAARGADPSVREAAVSAGFVALP